MPDDKKSPGLLDWLFGAKAPETPDAAAARKKKEDQERQARENIQKAINGYGTLKKVVKDAETANKKNQ